MLLTANPIILSEAIKKKKLLKAKLPMSLANNPKLTKEPSTIIQE